MMLPLRVRVMVIGGVGFAVVCFFATASVALAHLLHIVP
jgi:hypothetical protein